MSPSSAWQDSRICYDRYELSAREKLTWGGIGLLLGVAIDYVFYRSLWMMIALLPLAGIVPGWYRSRQIEKQREQLGRQFKDAVLALSAALQAGYSVENAWTEAWREMTALYGEQGLISREFAYMVKALAVNETLEHLVQDLAKRSRVPEIKSFADVFCMAKRSSGDLVTIMEHTAQMIHEKLRVREEIITQTSAKRLEETIMSVIPAGIILYLNFAFEGFLAPLYEGVTGRGIMTGCLLVYGAAIGIGWYLVQPRQW